MDPKNPFVSVIIPTYNYARFVSRAIDSALSQSYQQREVIVVDDGSTDNTREVLKAYGDRITCLHQENRRMSAARNTGIAHAKGELIAFLDADDVWFPRKLEKQIELLHRLPESVGAVCTGVEVLIDGMPDSSRVEKWQTGVLGREFRQELLIRNCVSGSCSSVLLRRECVERVGLFDESLLGAEDWDMWLRVSKHYDFAIVAEPLASIAVHRGSVSKKLKRMIRYHVRVMERHLPRRMGPVRRALLKGKSLSYMLYSTGTECTGVDEAMERKLFWLSIRHYPGPDFYPVRYRALLRTLVGSERYRRVGRILRRGKIAAASTDKRA